MGWENQMGKESEARQNASQDREGEREILTDHQMATGCVSETEGCPVRLESLGSLWAGDGGELVRGHTWQRALGNEGLRLKYTGEQLKGFTHLAATSR